MEDPMYKTLPSGARAAANQARPSPVLEAARLAFISMENTKLVEPKFRMAWFHGYFVQTLFGFGLLESQEEADELREIMVEILDPTVPEPAA